MYHILKDNRGVMFPIAIMLLFITMLTIFYYIFSFESQIKVYNSLEFANVRATINLLEEISNK
ncbi:Flp pilus assembly protein TadG [Lysinibacillus composti]|nr:Flp pilus assembly protein TadG [Lysinibacillus composti]